MNDEQRTAELMALDGMSTAELWEKAIILRDEIIENNEEIPYLILSKSDEVIQYLDVKEFDKNDNNDLVLDLNDILDITREGFFIKMIPELLAEKGFFTLGTSDSKGIYGAKGNKKRYTLSEICEERSLRKRILKRILRKILSNEERDYSDITLPHEKGVIENGK